VLGFGRARFTEERGQALALLVLLLVPLLGISAFAIDVGSWYHVKRQMQATADAAALAGAQALPTDTGQATSLALQYAADNGGDVSAGGVSISSGLSANDTISVQATTTAPGVFSKLLGIDTVNIGATAAARVAIPSQAEYVAPMVVSDKHPLLAGPGCPCFGQDTTLGYDPLGAPGAFGMINLDNSGGTLGSSTEADWILHGYAKYLPLGDYPSDPGAKFSSGEIQSALDARIGTVLLFPVYHLLTGTGSGAQYLIVGWVGFMLDSYTVHGNNATLNGHFTTYIAQGIQSTTSTGQPDFGVRSVQLIQ
jgi:Flp pilus assembly protein TadG